MMRIAMPWEKTATVPFGCASAISVSALRIRSRTSAKLSQPSTCHFCESLLK